MLSVQAPSLWVREHGCLHPLLTPAPLTLTCYSRTKSIDSRSFQAISTGLLRGPASWTGQPQCSLSLHVHMAVVDTAPMMSAI